MEPESVELRPHGGEADRPPEGRQEFSLPPADGGKDAWLFLAAAFFLEALIWGKSLVFFVFPLPNCFANAWCLRTGFPFSYGVFQEYYSTHEPFVSEPFGIAAIGTTALVSRDI
jgi:hypothetical protein